MCAVVDRTHQNMWRTTYDLPTTSGELDEHATKGLPEHVAPSSKPFGKSTDGFKEMMVLGSYPRLVVRLDDDERSGRECDVSTGLLTSMRRSVLGYKKGDAKDSAHRLSSAKVEVNKASYNMLVKENADVMNLVAALNYLSSRGEDLISELKLREGDEERNGFETARESCVSKIKEYMESFKSIDGKNPSNMFRRLIAKIPYPGKARAELKMITKQLEKMDAKIVKEIEEAKRAKDLLALKSEEAAEEEAVHLVTSNPRKAVDSGLKGL